MNLNRKRTWLKSIILSSLLIAATVFWLYLLVRNARTEQNRTSVGVRRRRWNEARPRDLQLVRAGVRQMHGAMSNVPEFGRLAAGTPVLLVTAGRHLPHLRRLLAHLERVHYIQTALLVISHSYYDERINALVNSVRFCRVMQIFFLHSMQLHPTGFPGPTVGECDPAAVGEHDSARAGHCTPRDALLLEGKHHWWWTVNYAFERLDSIAGPTFFIFLEDRYVVAPDLLYMAIHVQQALSMFPEVQLLALGGPPPTNGAADSSLLVLDNWRPAFAAGLAFNRSIWREISALSTHFCMFNDSSWSHSIANVFSHLPSGRAVAIRCAMARIWEPGGEKMPENVYPPRVRVKLPWAAAGTARAPPPPPPAPVAAGGWADRRDHALCLDPTLDVLYEEYNMFEEHQTNEIVS